VETVPVELETRPGLERQPARKKPHQRARVADVDRLVLRERVAKPAPADQQPLGARLDDRP